MPAYRDLLYEKQGRRVTITFNRPHRYNALTQHTFGEFADALVNAAEDREAGVVVITGAGGKAFSSGGDVKERTPEGYGESTLGRGVNIMRTIKTMPKPVIAAVDGYAIGWGNILAFNCDITICTDRSRFGQTGPRVGSFDVGWGTVYLARVVGQKKAREIWYTCRQYTGQQALEMGLVNAVVPADRLQEEVDTWCSEILAKSPTAIAHIKASFNADTDHIYGVHQMGHMALEMYYATEESQEGGLAFNEKREPNFGKYLSPKIVPQG
ncbi:MAG: enoyl-CoA hydratase/isomerase family protein [Chloroflexi bacterium]|nr:enoyl-CoA hydratase/isomerase family protein [Chloroflexota bacterium]